MSGSNSEGPAGGFDPLRSAALVIALAAAAIGLAALGGGSTIELDLLNHVALASLAAATVAGLTWIGRGRRGWITPALVAVALAALAIPIGPEWAAGLAQTRSGPRAEILKIVQFNLFKDNRDPERTARWILDQHADVLVLEEVVGRSEAVVARLRGTYPYETRCRIEAVCPTKMMSRRAPLPLVEPPFRPGAGDLRFMTFAGAAGPFTVMGLQFTWPEPFTRQDRSRAALAYNARFFRQDSLVITGDFNLTPWSFALRRMDPVLGVVRRTHGIPTWPARAGRVPLPALLPIDQVYAGADWRLVSLKRGPRLGSDHYPLVVVFTR